MKSLKKMAELADRFEHKLTKVALESSESNLGPAVVDAFFDPAASDKNEKEFSKHVNQPSSNLSKAMQAAWQSVQKGFDITIGAAVNVPAGRADWIVNSTQPLPNPVMNNLKAALTKDYQSFYGADPASRVKAKATQKILNPANLNASNPSIITGIGIG